MKTKKNDDDSFVFGFDGSAGRKRGNADGTAIVGCRVTDGLMWVIDHWEVGTEAPRDEIESKMDEILDNEWCVGGRADHAGGWGPSIKTWETLIEKRFWHPHIGIGVGKWSQDALARLVDAINADPPQVFWDIDSDPLLGQLLNVKLIDGVGVQENTGPNARKIDVAMAAAYAQRAREDALGKRPRPHTGGAAFL